ncbi:MAG: MCP four helix bundle domain-containing protein [Syntrophorhabdales bacterium]
MKLFTDVKIGRRLGIGFGIILGLMVIMVIAEVAYLSAIKGNIERLESVNTFKLKTANDVRIALSNISFLIGRIVTSPEDSVRQEARKKIEETRAAYRKGIEVLEKTEVNKEGQALLATLKEAVAKGKDANNEAIELGMAGKATEAGQRYGRLTGTTAAYLEAADNIVLYEEERIKLSLPGDHQQYHHTHKPVCRAHRPHGERRFLYPCLGACPQAQRRDGTLCQIHGCHEFQSPGDAHGSHRLGEQCRLGERADGRCRGAAVKRGDRAGREGHSGRGRFH